MTPRLLIATNNPGKVQEFRRLLAACGRRQAGTPWELVSPADISLHLEVAETGATFEENALLKARAFARAARTLEQARGQARSAQTADRSAGPTCVLTDDSGIEVEALGGRPGVHSARYGGPGLTDDERVRLLLRELAGVPRERRRCRYVAVVAIVLPADDPVTAGTGGPLEMTFGGTCDGTVAFEPAGSNGFGYDPVFLPSGAGEAQGWHATGSGQTMGQLPAEAKDAISHRGVALRKAAAYLRSLPGLGWPEARTGETAAATP